MKVSVTQNRCSHIRGNTSKYKMLAAILSFFPFLLFSFTANAEDINEDKVIDYVETDNQTFNADGLTLDIIDGGYIDGGAIRFNGSVVSAATINIDTTVGLGIVDDDTAIFLDDSNVILNINLLSGRIHTSNNIDTITMASASNSTINLTIGEDGVVSNDEDTGIATLYGGGSTNTININNAGLIFSQHTDAIEGSGSLNLTNSGTITAPDNAVNMFGSGLVSITNQGTINGQIKLGTNAASYLTHSAGAINGDIRFGNAAQQVNLNGGSFTGNIDGLSSRMGIVNIGGDFTLASGSTIGATNGVDTLNIINGGNFTIEGSVNVDNFNINEGGTLTLNALSTTIDTTLLSGMVDFGNSDRTYVSNVTGFGSGGLNLESASHTIDGTLDLSSGDKISLHYSTVSNGRLTVNGVSNISALAKVNINYDKSDGYLNDFSSKLIFDGNGGVVNALSDFDYNGSDFTILNFSTQVQDSDDLYLSLSGRIDSSQATQDKNAQNTYNAIYTIAENSSNELLDFQHALEASTSSAQLTSTLQTATPQSDDGVRQTSINIFNNSASAIHDRLDQLRREPKVVKTKRTPIRTWPEGSYQKQKFVTKTLKSIDRTNKSRSPFKLKTLNKPTVDTQHVASLPTKTQTFSVPINLAKLNSSTHRRILNDLSITKPKAFKPVNHKIYKGKSQPQPILPQHVSDSVTIWTQASNITTTQTSDAFDAGYDASTTGFIIGADKRLDKDTNIGVSISHADSDITSTHVGKNTDMQSTALSVYSSHILNRYFIDNIISASVNSHDTTRSISAINQTANASYKTISYMAKIRAGITKTLGNINLTPQLSLAYINSPDISYNENGAGTMNLTTHTDGFDLLELGAVVDLSYQRITRNNTIIRPSLRFGYSHDILGKTLTSTSTFQGHTAAFTTTHSEYDPATIKIATALNISRNNILSLDAQYGLEIKKKYQNHVASVKGSYRF